MSDLCEGLWITAKVSQKGTADESEQQFLKVWPQISNT